MLNINILTLMPEDFKGFLSSHIVKRAIKNQTANVQVIDIKQFVKGSFRKIDDSPYGGGAGMILRYEPIVKAINALKHSETFTILMSPSGQTYNQAMARKIAHTYDNIIMICGHYEGVDERVMNHVDLKLSIGDYVVHSTFGIGKYLGIVTLSPKGLKKDYLHIEYKDNDKLYIPVEKIEYIVKYSSNEGIVPRLSKLGGTDWVKQKARVRGKVQNIAKELLTTSAHRRLLKGFAFLSDDEDQYKFENAFEYQETPDQLKSIKEIKEDMELPYPMDRLLCGDVGYGKTAQQQFFLSSTMKTLN